MHNPFIPPFSRFHSPMHEGRCGWARHAHPRGFHGVGHGAGRHGFWGRGGDAMPGGRKLSAADLQLVILALLEKAPAHGYEIIRALETRSQGFYVPSPGVVYPALTYLDEIGHAASETSGNRKLYSLSESGRKALDAERDKAEAILEALARIGARMDEVRRAFAGEDTAGEGSEGSGAREAWHRARHALKEALARKRGCDAAEARRIAAILERAAAEIGAGTR